MLMYHVLRMGICIVFVSLFKNGYRIKYHFLRLGVCKGIWKQMFLYVFSKTDTIIIYPFLRSDTNTIHVLILEK